MIIADNSAIIIEVLKEAQHSLFNTNLQSFFSINLNNIYIHFNVRALKDDNNIRLSKMLIFPANFHASLLDAIFQPFINSSNGLLAAYDLSPAVLRPSTGTSCKMLYDAVSP